MINRQSETARMAVLGSVGMDAVAPGSSGTTILPISLVKSDWKLQQKPAPGQFLFLPPQPPFVSSRQGAF